MAAHAIYRLYRHLFFSEINFDDENPAGQPGVGTVCPGEGTGVEGGGV